MIIVRLLIALVFLFIGWEGLALFRWLLEQPSDFAVALAIPTLAAAVAIPVFGCKFLFENKKEKE